MGAEGTRRNRPVVHDAEALHWRLESAQSLEDWEELFADWGYEFDGRPYPLKDWPDRLKQKITSASTFASAGIFHVLHVELVEDRRGLEREVAARFRKSHPLSMLLCQLPNGVWDLVNLHFDDETGRRSTLRRFRIEPGQVNRTTCERLLLLRLTGVPTAKYQAQVDDAFSVQAITRRFFVNYQQKFLKIKAHYEEHRLTERDAHDAAQRLLNRLMFLHFVQAKGWMHCGDRDHRQFLREYRRAYIQLAQKPGSRSHMHSLDYHKDWLGALFFYGLNGEEIPNFPSLGQETKKWLKGLPFLNGGLFKRDDLDAKVEEDGAYIPFLLLTEVQEGLLEQFNFTISESDWDSDVAVDPAMLGHVYESLVLSEERGKAGIFYTQPIEIEMMTRMPLFHYLLREMEWEPESKKGRDLARLVIDLPTVEEDQDLAEAFTKQELNTLLDKVEKVTICDPACGSGAFLVGSMNLIKELEHRLYDYLGREPLPDFELKKRIIERNIYGGELKAWAAEVSRLRLWLSLIVKAELSDFKPTGPSKLPILPSLHFKVGEGDSLVQLVGGKHVNLRDERNMSSADAIRAKLEKLAHEKHRFFDNEYEFTPQKARDKILPLQKEVFLAFLDQEIAEVRGQIRRNTGATSLGQFGGSGPKEAVESDEVGALRAKVTRLEELQEEVKRSEGLPFVWDITFAEVLLQRGGFDIVIGNPPYVRQEKIETTDPDRLPTRDHYKGALYDMALAEWPQASPPKGTEQMTDSAFQKWWEKNPKKRTSGWPFLNDKKTDLYVYFFLKGLSLLRPGGTFCFITSNSWLDVGYGKNLQAFLCQHIEIKAIIDNLAKRSFDEADINTTITVFQKPKGTLQSKEHKARFIAFLKPFEEGFRAETYHAAVTASEKGEGDVYRVNVFDQERLYLEGTSAARLGKEPKLPTEGMKPVHLAYTGNKWGGLYLKAPTLYWKIVEEASHLLVPLSDLADVKRGFTSGANDFFYVRVLDSFNQVARVQSFDGEIHEIEANYVENPILVRTKEITRPLLGPNDLTTRVVQLPPKGNLGKGAKAYIAWGTKTRHDSKGAQIGRLHERPTLANRNPWYSLPPQELPDIAFPKMHKRRPVAALLHGRQVFLDQRCYAIYCRSQRDARLMAAWLISSFSVMTRELLGRANFGQGLLEMSRPEVQALPVINPEHVSEALRTRVLMAFETLAERPIRMIYDEIGQDDRITLEAALLEVLGYDPATAKSLARESLVLASEMIWRRMAKTSNAREARQDFRAWLDSGEPFDLSLMGAIEEDEVENV